MEAKYVIAGTRVVIQGVQAFRKFETGEIVASGAHLPHKPWEKDKPRRMVATVRITSGAYHYREMNIGIDKLTPYEGKCPWCDEARIEHHYDTCVEDFGYLDKLPVVKHDG